jgi:hypothetical protein
MVTKIGQVVNVDKRGCKSFGHLVSFSLGRKKKGVPHLLYHFFAMASLLSRRCRVTHLTKYIVRNKVHQQHRRPRVVSSILDGMSVKGY